jgi:hypothetical protein
MYRGGGTRPNGAWVASSFENMVNIVALYLVVDSYVVHPPGKIPSLCDKVTASFLIEITFRASGPRQAEVDGGWVL